MDCEALFTTPNKLQGSNFMLRRLCCSGSVQLSFCNRYQTLFVLGGTLMLFSDRTNRKVSASEMVLADRTRFVDIFCTRETILLEYLLPGELTLHFDEAFPKLWTPAIPVTGRLEEWVEELLSQIPEKAGSEATELVNLLLKYQSRKLRPLCGPMKQYVDEFR